jgi:hypothetical protein
LEFNGLFQAEKTNVGYSKKKSAASANLFVEVGKVVLLTRTVVLQENPKFVMLQHHLGCTAESC